MDENQLKTQQTDSQKITPNEELGNLPEVTLDSLSLNEEVLQAEPEVLVLRHPQQILTNKQIQILLNRQAAVKQAKEDAKKNGTDPDTIEDLSVEDQTLIKWLILRMKHHNSKPALLSTKQRTARKKKRRISNQSRKANR